MKKIFAVMLVFSIFFIWAGFASAKESSVYFDGQRHGDDLPLYNIEGVDYASLVDLKEILDLSVEWEPVSRRIVFKTERGDISLLIDNPRIIVNERIAYLNNPSRFLNSGVVIPMQFLTDFLPEILGYKISWSPEESRLDIEKKQKVIIGEKEDFSPVELSSLEEKEPVSPRGAAASGKKKSSVPGNYRIDLVVIDPGHGGRDPGAIGRKGLKEKDVVLDIAHRVSSRLKEKGIRIIMTRDRDQFVSLDERAAIANRNRADLFLSIHANAAFSRRANGFETFYVSEAVDDHARAIAAIENSVLELENNNSRKKLDNTLHAILWDLAYTEFRVESIEWGELLQRELCKIARGENRGVKPGPFYVLKGAQMPSILVEVGFISNVVEESSLRKSSYRDKIADAIANSVLYYKKVYEKKAGFTR